MSESDLVLSKNNKKYFILVFIFFFLSQIFASSDLLELAKQQFDSAHYKKASEVYREWISENENLRQNDSVFLDVLSRLSRTELLNYNYKETAKLNDTLILLAKRKGLPYFFYKANISQSDLYRNLQEFEKGKKNLLSLQFKKADSLKYLELVADKYHRLAALYNESSILDSAMYCSMLSLSISRKLNLSDNMATIYNEIGNIFEKTNSPDSARFYYQMACKIWKDEKNIRYFSNGYFNLARTYFTRHQYDSCIYHLKVNLNRIHDKDWPNVKYPIYHYLSQSYFAKQDSVSGYKMKVLETEEFLKSERIDHERNLLELEAVYQNKENTKLLESKELLIKSQNETLKLLVIGIISILFFLLLVFYFYRKSISVQHKLNNANSKLDEQNRDLTRLLKENEFLIQEAHHRIKNNLQLIISLIQMELGKEENKNFMSPLQSISSKIETISTLHKQLYINQELDTISAKKFLSDISSNLSSLLKNQDILIQLDFGDIKIPLKIAVYFGLIFNELITNSAKHAFRQDQIKIISATLKEENDKIIFNYSDNGENEFLTKKEGKGLHLIRILCKQVNGEMASDLADKHSFRLTLLK